NRPNFGHERDADRTEGQPPTEQQSSSTTSYGHSFASGTRQPTGPVAPRIETYQAFRQLFMERFKRQLEEQREVKASLWKTRQGTDETTEDFVNTIRKKGELYDANDEEMYTAAVSGLRTDVKA